MMLGESHHTNPTVLVPPWPTIDDPTADPVSYPFPVSGVTVDSNGNASPLFLTDALTALQRFLPSNAADVEFDSDSERESDAPIDAYSCDHFRMYEFKVRRCARGRSHDWTECPYAHPGEKARRRDPRKFSYSGTACPDYRKGNCRKGDTCEYAHGVFECWLHPSRYRTQPCKDGTSCRRRVCFFAHTPEQLRVVTNCLSPKSPTSVDSYDGSPLRQAIEASCVKTLPFLPSPPLSPRSESSGSPSVGELVSSLRQIQLGKVKSLPVGSPRGGGLVRPGFCSLPATPTRVSGRPGFGYVDAWDKVCEEEPVMERVESGRDLRAKMFEKLSKENSFARVDPGTGSGSGPDVGWVSELVM